MKQYRRNRLVLSHFDAAPLVWMPRFHFTGDDWSMPWVWRIFWLRLCLGLLKTDWNRPVVLTRQLRRQLERKGRLILGPVAALLLFLCPAFGYSQDWCPTPDAILAQAIIRYKTSQGYKLDDLDGFELFLRAQGQGPCHQTPAGADETARIFRERAERAAWEAMIVDAVTWAVLEREYYRRYGSPYRRVGR